MRGCRVWVTAAVLTQLAVACDPLLWPRPGANGTNCFCDGVVNIDVAATSEVVIRDRENIQSGPPGFALNCTWRFRIPEALRHAYRLSLSIRVDLGGAPTRCAAAALALSVSSGGAASLPLGPPLCGPAADLWRVLALPVAEASLRVARGDAAPFAGAGVRIVAALTPRGTQALLDARNATAAPGPPGEPWPVAYAPDTAVAPPGTGGGGGAGVALGPTSTVPTEYDVVDTACVPGAGAAPAPAAPRTYEWTFESPVARALEVSVRGLALWCPDGPTPPDNSTAVGVLSVAEVHDGAAFPIAGPFCGGGSGGGGSGEALWAGTSVAPSVRVRLQLVRAAAPCRPSALVRVRASPVYRGTIATCDPTAPASVLALPAAVRVPPGVRPAVTIAVPLGRAGYPPGQDCVWRVRGAASVALAWQSFDVGMPRVGGGCGVDTVSVTDSADKATAVFCGPHAALPTALAPGGGDAQIRFVSGPDGRAGGRAPPPGAALATSGFVVTLSWTPTKAPTTVPWWVYVSAIGGAVVCLICPGFCVANRLENRSRRTALPVLNPALIRGISTRAPGSRATSGVSQHARYYGAVDPRVLDDDWTGIQPAPVSA